MGVGGVFWSTLGRGDDCGDNVDDAGVFVHFCGELIILVIILKIFFVG